MRLDIEKKDDLTIYQVRFKNLTDLYDYLISDPPVNSNIFRSQESATPDFDFYGEPLDKAIQYCIKGYNKGFNNFLSLNNELKHANIDLSNNRKAIRSLYGGIPLSHLVASGIPDCMLKYDRDMSSSVRNIYFNLGYPWHTNDQMIINRGLATMYIIQSLEEKGEMVNFRLFELTTVAIDGEMVNMEVNLKKPGDLFLDIEKCYFPIKSKEFLRRIFFRVLESTPVESLAWSHSYGKTANEDEVKAFFNVTSDDLIISSPQAMGIEGKNIYDDTIALIDKLNLNEEFDIEKIKKLKNN